MHDHDAITAGIRFVEASGWPSSLNVGHDMEYVATNALYDAMLGRCVVGLGLLEAFPELTDQGVVEMRREVMRTQQAVRHEDRRIFLRDEDGVMRERYFSFTYQPWFGAEGVVGVLTMARETTRDVYTRIELNQTLGRLESERGLLNRLVAHAPVAIGLAQGPEWTFQVCNPAMASILFRSISDILGVPLFQVAPELEEQGFRDLLDEVAATGEPYIGAGVRVTVLEPDGTAHERRFDFVYERLPGDVEPVEVLIVAHDVTTIHDAREGLEQTLKAREDFSRAVAHDLRTPLNAISGWMQVLARMRSDPTRVEQAVRVVQRNVDAITQLLDDLSMARANAATLELQRRDVDLGALVADAVEALRPQAADVHLTVTTRLAPRCDVFGDPTRLQRVINNLLANAVKYGAPTDDATAGVIRVRVERSGEQVVLSVADEGRGMDVELIQRVFEPYVQGNAESPGLGLGLAISRSLVEAHGGSIEARSDGRGKGSTFVVRLPYTAPTTPLDETLEEAPRALLVEDHADTRAFMVELLRMCGLEVHAVRDGAEAMAFLEGADVDIVVSDLNMPRIDGVAMAHAFAAQGLQLPSIAITANTDAETVARAREAGFQLVLAKPVTLETLRDAIDRTLRSAPAGPSDAL